MLRFTLGCLALCLLAGGARAATTQQVFQRVQARIVQVHILEASSGARAGLGSGFVVGADGLIVTNYHVVADLVLHPARYRGEILTHDRRVGNLTLVDFDAVHDLALVRADLPMPSPLRLAARDVRIGTRAFSLGTPLDLGYTIVEGTYNGLLKDSLYEKIHFTGSINPGMSGGPTVLENGQVIGVNVATAGNQVSFLVPAHRVAALLRRAKGQLPIAPDAALARLREQLLANQDTYMGQLLSRPMATVALGEYQVPTRFVSFLRCWGDAKSHPEHGFDQLTQQCSTEDNLYLSRTQETGIVHFEHIWLAGRGLNRFRFYNLYQARFNADYPGIQAAREDVTRFSCQTDFVQSGLVIMKASLCLRAYRRLPGLYDAVLKAATVNHDHRGVQTTLVLGGISARNATRFAKRYLGSFRWTP